MEEWKGTDEWERIEIPLSELTTGDLRGSKQEKGIIQGGRKK